MSTERNVASLLTAKDVAERWGVSRQTVTSLYRRGALRGFRPGRALRFRADDILAFEDERTRGPLTGDAGNE